MGGCHWSRMASEAWVYLHVYVAYFVQVAHARKQEVPVRDPQQGTLGCTCEKLIEAHEDWSPQNRLEGEVGWRGSECYPRGSDLVIWASESRKKRRGPRTHIHSGIWRKGRRGWEGLMKRRRRDRRRIIVLLIVLVVTTAIAVALIVIVMWMWTIWQALFYALFIK